MLPKSAHDAILNALPSAFWVDVGEGAFPDNPDASEWRIGPEYRWADEDFEEPTAPFEHVTLIETQSVEESTQPLDDLKGFAELDDTVDADAVTFDGRWVYDEIEIRTTVEGSETRDGLTLTAGQRCRLLARAVYNYVVHRMQSAPLDHFDADGNAVADTGLAYADEFIPPVRVDEIPGRGPMNTSDLVDANGAQWNAAVELHYVDGVLKYEYIPDSGDAQTSLGN